MGYQVLYRKYRPQTFEEVVGQDYIIQTLKNAIANNQIAHAYLFAGPRGTGKTSTAKLFAKMINCSGETSEKPCNQCENCLAYNNGNHPDIFELDAASNNKVDDIRDLIENVNYPPVMGKYKVYIIDEVHMLTTQAFNAFLKTLEEPPTNVIFILATTEPQKIIPTVLSRCQRYNFTKIETPVMRKRLIYILEQEHIPYDEDALDLIMSLSDGGMRDVLSILEQVLAYGNQELRSKDVNKIYGLLTNAEKVKLLVNVRNNKTEEVINDVRKLYQNGIDIKRMTSDFIEILKECIIYQETKNKKLLKYNSVAQTEEILNYYDSQALLAAIDILINTIDEFHQTQDVLSYLEIALLKIEMLNSTFISKEIKVEKPDKSVAKEQSIAKKQEPVKEPETQPKEEQKTLDNLEDSQSNDEKTNEESLEEPINKVIEQGEDLTEKVNLEFETVNVDDQFLLSILFNANKEEKNSDMIIYRRLSDFRLDPTKRKFFNYLKGTEIFASQKDAIIFCCSEDVQVSQINDVQNNQEIYFFLKDELNIDKMVYAINNDQKVELAQKFVQMSKQNQHLEPPVIQRYQHEDTVNKISIEDKLTDFFGEVKIEEK